MKIDLKTIYHQGLNFSERIYQLPETYTGEATAAALRTDTPKRGIKRIPRAICIGAANGFVKGNRLGRALSTPALNNYFFSGAISAPVLLARQDGLGATLRARGLKPLVVASADITFLAGTGNKRTYDPDSDNHRYLWIFPALGRYGLLGLATELPLYKLAGNSHPSVAKVALLLACAARLVLEIPRALLTAVATVLWIGVPAVVGALLGAAINGLQAIGCDCPPEHLVASGKQSLNEQGVQFVGASSAEDPSHRSKFVYAL